MQAHALPSLTGASRSPVKNFLIWRETTIWAGVTSDRRTQGLPAKKGSIIIWYVTLWMHVGLCTYVCTKKKKTTSTLKYKIQSYVRCKQSRLSYCTLFVTFPPELLEVVCNRFSEDRRLQQLNCLDLIQSKGERITYVIHESETAFSWRGCIGRAISSKVSVCKTFFC